MIYSLWLKLIGLVKWLGVMLGVETSYVLEMCLSHIVALIISEQ